MAVQGMNIEIPAPEGKTKYLGQLITFKNAVQVEFDHQTTRLNTTTKTSTSTKKAAPASTISPTTIQKTSQNRGSTT